MSNPISHFKILAGAGVSEIDRFPIWVDFLSNMTAYENNITAVEDAFLLMDAFPNASNAEKASLGEEILEKRAVTLIQREDFIRRIQELCNTKESDQTENKSGDMCVICQQTLKQKDLVVKLPCSHTFHHYCILKGFFDSRVPKCFLCRISMPKSIISNLTVKECSKDGESPF